MRFDGNEVEERSGFGRNLRGAACGIWIVEVERKVKVAQGVPAMAEVMEEEGHFEVFEFQSL